MKLFLRSQYSYIVILSVLAKDLGRVYVVEILREYARDDVSWSE
jgi:hypothetical protein